MSDKETKPREFDEQAVAKEAAAEMMRAQLLTVGTSMLEHLYIKGARRQFEQDKLAYESLQSQLAEAQAENLKLKQQYKDASVEIDRKRAIILKHIETGKILREGLDKIRIRGCRDELTDEAKSQVASEALAQADAVKGDG